MSGPVKTQPHVCPRCGEKFYEAGEINAALAHNRKWLAFYVAKAIREGADAERERLARNFDALAADAKRSFNMFVSGEAKAIALQEHDKNAAIAAQIRSSRSSNAKEATT